MECSDVVLGDGANAHVLGLLDGGDELLKGRMPKHDVRAHENVQACKLGRPAHTRSRVRVGD
eukprot:1639451-Prymnesium_polylepis.1